MSYEIIIKKTETESKMVQGDWQKIDETFFTEEDVKKLDWMDKTKKESAEVKDLKKNVMGYPPKIEKLVTQEKEVYRQTVEELDLRTVINAINKIS